MYEKKPLRGFSYRTRGREARFSPLPPSLLALPWICQGVAAAPGHRRPGRRLPAHAHMHEDRSAVVPGLLAAARFLCRPVYGAGPVHDPVRSAGRCPSPSLACWPPPEALALACCPGWPAARVAWLARVGRCPRRWPWPAAQAGPLPVVALLRCAGGATMRCALRRCTQRVTHGPHDHALPAPPGSNAYGVAFTALRVTPATPPRNLQY